MIRPRRKFRTDAINLHKSIILKKLVCVNRISMAFDYSYTQTLNFLRKMSEFFRNHPELLTTNVINEINSLVHAECTNAVELWEMDVVCEHFPVNYFLAPTSNLGGSVSSPGSPESVGSSSFQSSSGSPLSTGEAISTLEQAVEEIGAPLLPVKQDVPHPAPEEEPSSSYRGEIDIELWIGKVLSTLRYITNPTNKGERGVMLSRHVWNCYLDRCTWRIISNIFKLHPVNKEVQLWFHA